MNFNISTAVPFVLIMLNRSGSCVKFLLLIRLFVQMVTSAALDYDEFVNGEGERQGKNCFTDL